MQITFKKYDGTAEKTLDVLRESKLGESREVAQMLLGLPENPPCKVILKRTDKELEDSLTFEQADVRDGDNLILFTLNTFNVDRETKDKSNVSRNIKKTELQSSFNPKAWQKLLLASSIVVILGVVGTLYLQIHQQNLIVEQLKQEQSQGQTEEKNSQEENKPLLDDRQTLSDPQHPLGNFENSNWLVSISHENNTYYYRGKDLRSGDSLSLAGAEVSGDNQQHIYTWNNQGYLYQVTWQPMDSSYIHLKVFAPDGKELLNEILKQN
jgi:hypothetical protein